jgi:antitoxin (DNA-binding transcriptional repressor) of toxin-antitoxin stability system
MTVIVAIAPSERQMPLRETTYDPTYNQSVAVLRISEADLARDVRTVLDRVQSGAEVIVERNSQPVAVLRAAEPRRRKLSEIAAALPEDSTAAIDPNFEKDVQEFVDSHREALDSSAWD